MANPAPTVSPLMQQKLSPDHNTAHCAFEKPVYNQGQGDFCDDFDIDEIDYEFTREEKAFIREYQKMNHTSKKKHRYVEN